MKTKIYILFFLLISATYSYSQATLLNAAGSNEQKIPNIKKIECRYNKDKVYLHITVNSDTTSKILFVERSLDASYYEKIGYIKINGNSLHADIGYYFIDESPLKANLYYRLSYYPAANKPSYSEIANVFPVDVNITPSSYLAVTSFSNR